MPHTPRRAWDHRRRLFREPFVKESTLGGRAGWALAMGTSTGGEVRVNAEGRSLRVSAGRPTYVDPKP